MSTHSARWLSWSCSSHYCVFFVPGCRQKTSERTYVVIRAHFVGRFNRLSISQFKWFMCRTQQHYQDKRTRNKERCKHWLNRSTRTVATSRCSGNDAHVPGGINPGVDKAMESDPAWIAFHKDSLTLGKELKIKCFICLIMIKMENKAYEYKLQCS